MRFRLCLACAVSVLLSGCGPRDEFPHQTVQAYQADGTLRQSTLQACADHITSKTPFRSQSDTDECQKALAADQNVHLSQYLEKKRAANAAALNEAARQFEAK